MKAVMYHYVRPGGRRPPNYYYLDLEDFRRQLDHFEAEYGFVDRDTFLRACAGDDDVPEGGVVLTFDDGLVDHYEWVVSELSARGLWGIFYVPTGPLVGGSVLNVHRIHALLGTYGGDRVLGELEPRVTDEMVPDDRVDEFRNETYTRQENDESTTLVKRLLNYYVSYDHRASLLDDLVDVLPEADVPPEDIYMTADQLGELQDAGMLVGSHSVSHRVFSKLSVEEQRAEIFESFDALEGMLDGLTVRTFCYPYGGFHTFTDDTRRLLREAGSEFSFNVESRDLRTDDVKESPQALPRYDCNEFEYGSASGSLGRADGRDPV